MNPAFLIYEWSACPKCGVIYEAPFCPPGAKEEEPELVLGSFFPEPAVVPGGDWKIEVTALCTACGHKLRALPAFSDACLLEFRSLEEPVQIATDNSGAAPLRV